MNKTFQCRLSPTRKQSTIFMAWLKLCCETYNAALQERRDASQMVGRSISYAQQCAELPACKEVHPDLAEVPAQVLQDVVKRVDLAFTAFFRRCAAREHPGYPRFKTRLRYDSLTFKQYGNSFAVQTGKKQQGTLILAKLGRSKWSCIGHCPAYQRLRS
jgi:putative transposase